MAVGGKNALDLDNQDTLILFFESDLNVPNAAGDPERDGCDPPRHRAPWAEKEGEAYNQVVYVTGETGWQETGEKEATDPRPAPR